MSITLAHITRDTRKPSCLINLQRIKSEHTLEYLHKNRLKNSDDLSKIVPVCYLEGVTKDFHSIIKTYDFQNPVDQVWDAYVNVPPSVAWSGRRIGFSFAYNPAGEEFHYEDDVYRGLSDNQLIFIVIKICFGLIKIAVTHHVNRVDHQSKIIKLCYVEGGKSAGSQILRFEPTGPDSSKVIHETYYKSESDFRDKNLYPMLHMRIINQLHKNMKKYLRN
jgi:hypothetical protein